MENFLTSILFLLVLARIFGEVLARFKQPQVVGEIIAGIVLGPALLNYIHPSAQLAGIAELTVFLILLSAGLEMNFKKVMEAVIGKGFVLGIICFVVPLAGGVALGLIFGKGIFGSLILGLCVAISALPVILRILENFKLLNSSVAHSAIATTMFNDIVALLCLGVILDLPKEATFSGLMESLSRAGGKLILFLFILVGVTIAVHWGGRGRTGFVSRGLESVIGWFGKQALFGMVVFFALIMGSVSESLGFHFVIGVFFAGLLISEDAIGGRMFRDLEGTVNSVTSGFLSPIFFGYIGLRFTWETLRSPVFTLLLVVVCMGTKILAARLAGRLLKMDEAESTGVGIILSGRGTMDLVVANVALALGYIDAALFSALVLLSVVATSLCPILFRKWVLGRLSPPTPPATAPTGI